VDALGEDVARLIKEGPKEALALTTNTQAGDAGRPASRPTARGSPRAAPSRPVLAGHSLGEYTALVAGRALALADAAPLVRFPRAGDAGRGAGGHRRDGRHPGPGARRGDRRLRAGRPQLRDEHQRVVEAVNFNDPAQTVIAGSKAAVEQGLRAAQGRGAKRALPLPVSRPSTPSLMKPAAERLRNAWPPRTCRRRGSRW
jgi:[acyl-carrier-protein] S-malonyltransferase